ncbi:MAG: sugar isomerase domain-containing protein [Clostridia bacterium]|nr:sugar isomerase domain-containing protein [Clostridia bacterium]
MDKKIPDHWPRNYPVNLKEKSFLEICKEFLDAIEEKQAQNMKKAGRIMGDKIMEDGLIWLFGTGGHTYVPVLDMSHRAGGFACVSPALDISSSPLNGGTRSIRVERVPGYFEAIVDYFRIEEGDVCVIFNNIGVHAAAIDACLSCKKRGATVIAVSSSVWQDGIPLDHHTRHPSKKNMRDIADLMIEDYNPIGDNVAVIDGFDRSFLPISTITDAYIVRRMEEEAIRYCISKGFTPPVWCSANTVNGDELNAALEEKYWRRVKML